MPDDQNRPFREFTESNGLGLSQSPLESAIDHVGRDARTTGEESFELRSEAAIAQRQALVRWAEENGLKLDPSLWHGKATIGGSEHDIWERDGEIWKVTRPDHFGWTVLPGLDGLPRIAEATPLEYLERWQNANIVLGDLVRLRGVSQTGEGVQVIISQPFINGPYPSPEDIRREMQKRGFINVPGFSIGSEADSSYFNDQTKTGIFDAASDNYIFSQGLPIPVDVIVIETGGELRRQLLRLILGSTR